MKSNYHTHTWRCLHATGADEEYILAAIKGGFTIIGFSDHGPLPYPDGHSSPIRMDLPQVEDYFDSIAALKAKYRDSITVHIGFEYEYLPQYMDFIQAMRQHPMVDYFILGNHYDRDDRTGTYFGSASTPAEILRYAKGSIAGMESGLFSYLAHPDLFLMSYPDFDDTARQVSHEICRAAKALALPLEYNLYGLEKIAHGMAGLGYPCRYFWEIAAVEGCSAIIGADAHQPDILTNLPLYHSAQHFLHGLSIPLVASLPMESRTAL